jgi:putative heme-binding domain-containing protein
MNVPHLFCARAACLFLATIASSQALAAEWQVINVPTASELPTPAWLRCFVRVPNEMVTPQEKDLWRDSVTVSVGGIEGAFAVFLNGQTLGEANALPAGERRRFKVPKGILEKGAFNVLALRLATARAVKMPPILAGYHDELPLGGAWQWLAGEPDPADLRAIPTQPASASFTEAAYRPATTPLSANPVLMPGARLSPAESLAKMSTADDLAVELIASEPQVAQPTHISFDERGRMWVAQYRQYPYPAGLKMISRDKYYRSKFDRVPPPPPTHDRGADIITMHEDTDGDGTFDKTTIALDGLNMANASLIGHGGLWVMQTPYLLFYPSADGDRFGPPEVRLAGFGLEDTHSVANGLAWGPDGWLYGAQGSTTTSRVEGIYYEGCMVWRYHPRTRAYEIFATGGGNVFELDFDSEGRLHSGHNGGETRGWHYMQGGHFLKQGIEPGKFGPPPNPFAFGSLGAMKSRHPIPRFTHATIVADGTALPTSYAGRYFGADPLHRSVIVAERFARGSTFETNDVGPALTGADPSFRPVYLTNAPDGAIYVADFYEEFIAHGQNYQGQIDPSTGRIFRIRGKNLLLEKDVNLAAKSSAQLIALLSHPNRWHRHTAVRLLGERRDPATVEPLRNALRGTAEHPALEALWALHQMQLLDEDSALLALAHPHAAVRTWSIRLLGDAKKLPPKFAAEVVRLTATEPDAEVRAQIASTAKRSGGVLAASRSRGEDAAGTTAGEDAAAKAAALVAALLRRDADASDPCIPLLCWWAIEPLCTHHADTVLSAIVWDSTMTKQHILSRVMRRFAAAGSRADLLTCARMLDAAPGAEHRQLLMTGFDEAFKGRAIPPLPDEFIASLTRHGLTSQHLRVRLREPAAIAAALQTASDENAKPEERLLCVRLFGEVKTPESIPALLQIAASAKPLDLRKAALTSLLLYDDRTIGAEIARIYLELPPAAQPAAQTLLASRAEWCAALLDLAQTGAKLDPAIAANLREHEDRAIATRAQELLPAPAPRPQTRAEIDRIRAVLAGGVGDPYQGEPIFLQRCAACHTLFHKGGRIGPDLTPYQREDLGTLLPSVVDPSAEIREGFVNQLVTTKDGRTLSGFLADQDANVIVLRGIDGQDVSLPRSDIRELRAAPASLMPEGILTGLDDQALRDFFAYLRISQPITP